LTESDQGRSECANAHGASRLRRVFKLSADGEVSVYVNGSRFLRVSMAEYRTSLVWQNRHMAEVPSNLERE